MTSLVRKFLSTRALIVATMAATVLFTAKPAQAELLLRWEVPDGCPQRDEVLERLHSLAGPVADKTEGWTAEGRIARLGHHFYLKLVVRDGTDVRTRELTAGSCTDLGAAAAVTLLILLGIEPASSGEQQAGVDASGTPGAEERGADPGHATARSNAAGRKLGTQSQAEENHREGTASSERGRSEPSPWAALLRAPELVVDFGPLPRPNPGLGFGGGVRYRSWRGMLTGHVFAGQTITASQQDSAFGAEVRRLNAVLAVCHGWVASRFELAACPGLVLEHLTARGFGEDVSPRTRRVAWVAAEAGLVLYLHAARWLAVYTEGALQLHFSRPVLEIAERGPITKISPVSAQATLGLEWIL